MIDKERLLSLLAVLDDYKKELDSEMNMTLNDYNKDSSSRRVAERILQLISETEIDIAEEVYKGLELKLSAEEKSMLQSLEPALGKSVILKVVQRRELRNQLVHAYAFYKDEEVFQQAKDISDVTVFETAVRKLL